MSASAVLKGGELLAKGGGRLLSGAARHPGTTAKWGLRGGAAYLGYEYLYKPLSAAYDLAKKYLGPHGALLAGVAAGAVALALLSKAVSTIGTVIKWGIGLLVGGVGLAFLANKFFGSSSETKTNNLTPSATPTLRLPESLRRHFGGTVDGPEEIRRPVKPPDLTVEETRSSVPLISKEGKAATVVADAGDATKSSSHFLGILKSIRAGTISARVGGNMPVVGTAFAVGAGGATAYLHHVQRSYAEALHKEGTLSDEAYEAYQTLNGRMQALFTGDIAISAADPTGLTLLATLGAEGTASKLYKDWADKYAPDLDPEALGGLNMSWFGAENAASEMLTKLRRHIPLSTEGQPPELHAVIKAKQELMGLLDPEDKSILPNPYARRIHDPVKREAALAHGREYWEKVRTAQDNFRTEMGRLVADPKNMSAYLNLVPLDDRLTHLRRLAASDKGSELLKSHPEVSTYMTTYNDSWTKWFIDAPPAASVNNFIMSMSGVSPTGISPTRSLGVRPELAVPGS